MHWTQLMSWFILFFVKCYAAPGNNVIPNVHFRKVNGMQKGAKNRAYMRTWLNQAGRKQSRQLARRAKAERIAPRPAAGLLRPVVHPPTQRYNMKLRLGRGFTLDELREAKISPKQARTIGIAVDHRRRNKCAESLQTNATRLKLYKSKLLLFPKGQKVKKGDSSKAELANVAPNTLKAIIPVPKVQLRVKARAITADEKEKSAWRTIRKARTNKKYDGQKRKKAEAKGEEK